MIVKQIRVNLGAYTDLVKASFLIEEELLRPVSGSRFSLKGLFCPWQIQTHTSFSQQLITIPKNRDFGVWTQYDSLLKLFNFKEDLLCAGD